MAITSDDIKLMQPERLTDDEDGGGQMTGNAVIDGDINNLFEDISRVNRTYGNVSLRKAFLKVDTASADLYLDAHSILSAQPQDPNVSGLIFTTNDFYDERDAARQRIESFVIQGPVTSLYLRGNQLQGQQTIICYAPRVNNVPAPEIGETFMLLEDDDLSTQQFIKVVDVTQSQETFTYFVSGSGDIRTFKADQYILQLSAELKQDYQAEDPSPRPDNATKIFSTQPAQSAKYYGTTSLAVSAASGASSVQVSETFAPIIPTASSETPVIDQRPGGFLSQVVPSAPGTIDVTVEVEPGNESQLPTAIVPGSITLNAAGEYTDKGGAFVNDSGNPGNLEGTVIDYRTGVISWAGSQSSSNASLSYRPGALRQQLPNTGKIEIDETNRNFNYVLSLDPPPAPTTFHASYQYLGKWYELEDDGTGTLVGDGSGQVNYDTGSVVLTLQAQPDASSVIFYRWTEGGIYSQEAGEAFSDTSPVHLSLVHGKVVRSSVTITWTAGGTEQTATDALGDGAIGGDATGTIDYAAGTIDITSAEAPDEGTGWTVEYTHKDEADLEATTTVPDNTNQSDIVLQTPADIEPGSVEFSLTKSIKRVVEDEQGVQLSENYRTERHRFTDNGQGQIINRRTNSAGGTVDYSTGEIVVSGTDFLKIRNS